MLIWAIGTTRNEVDLVRANVLHHLAQGVDRFLLLDNDSLDGTPDLLSELARSYPVEWASRAGSFRQDLLLTELAAKAFAAGADWVVPIDSDEFWHAPDSTIRRVLETTTSNALRVQLVNFVQHRYQRHTTPDALLEMTRTVATPVGPIERAEELVEAEEISYVEQLYHSKCLPRTSAALQIGWGNHTLKGMRESFEDTTRIVCLHAPLRSYEALQGKVDAGRPPDEIDEYFDKAWHLGRWRRLAWEDRLEAEWRANSYLDDRLDVYGWPKPVVVDHRLRDLVRPWLTVSRSTST